MKQRSRQNYSCQSQWKIYIWHQCVIWHFLMVFPNKWLPGVQKVSPLSFNRFIHFTLCFFCVISTFHLILLYFLPFVYVAPSRTNTSSSPRSVVPHFVLHFISGSGKATFWAQLRRRSSCCCWSRLCMSGLTLAVWATCDNTKGSALEFCCVSAFLCSSVWCVGWLESQNLLVENITCDYET